MKLLFFSDVHGVPSSMELLYKQADALQPDLLILLGDALYHGPRNGVPDFYDTTRTAELLNARAAAILAVRGNCDAEVDQAMLSFPMMADYAVLDAGTEKFFLTHGHLWNEYSLPPIGMGTVLAHGHTHVPELKRLACGISIFNPGSVALPKGGTSRSFGYFDGSELRHYVI